MARTEKCPQKILDMANRGIPLSPIEISRLAQASGGNVVKPRRVRQMVEELEWKLREMLADAIAELE